MPSVQKLFEKLKDDFAEVPQHELSLQDVLSAIRGNEQYRAIVFLLRNLEKPKQYLKEYFIDNLDDDSKDIFLSAILLSFIDSGNEEGAEDLSRETVHTNTPHNVSALGKSYLLYVSLYKTKGGV